MQPDEIAQEEMFQQVGLEAMESSVGLDIACRLFALSTPEVMVIQGDLFRFQAA